MPKKATAQEKAAAQEVDPELTEDELEAKVAAEAAEIDATTDTSESTADPNEPSSAAGMLKALSKASDGTNIMKETAISYSSASVDGVTKKGDIMHAASDMPGCLAKLKAIVEAAAKAKKAKKVEKWEFQYSPHVAMGRALDDTFTAFLMWARVEAKADEQDDDDEGRAGMINVHKAFRRLEVYAEWMEDNGEEMEVTSRPFTAAGMAPALKAWGMSMSYTKDEQLAWWVDMGALDLEAIKGGEGGVPLVDSMRAFVWLAHVAMYDPKCQLNGLVFVQNVGMLGFWASMTMMPMKLSVKLDRLTMGVIPCKMKLILCLDCPRWINIMFKIMSLFISKKLMKRMKLFKKDWNAVAEHLGAACIPDGFAGGECGGTLKLDPVVTPYVAQEGVAAIAVS